MPTYACYVCAQPDSQALPYIFGLTNFGDDIQNFLFLKYFSDISVQSYLKCTGAKTKIKTSYHLYCSLIEKYLLNASYIPIPVLSSGYRSSE